MKKLLVFGHIPRWFGGKQSSGLSNGMYQLAFNMANLTSSLDVSFVATDFHKAKSSEGNLKILGWDKLTILSYILRNIRTSILIFYKTCALYSKLYNVSLINLFTKRVLLKRWISKVEPDFVHFHGVNSCYLIDIIPKDIKIVVTMHHCLVNDKSVKNNAKYGILEKKICKSKRIHSIVFITNQVKDEFTLMYGNTIPKSQVILQGFEDNKYFHIKKKENKDDRINLCSIGSIAVRKGQMRVLEALKDFNMKFNYACVGGGDGKIIEELEVTAKKHNIRFRYLGIIETEKIRELLASVDFMILPSIKEGFGATYIESIACGVPVISPKNTPLAQENILNKSNSILIENETTESIKKCLAELDPGKFDHHIVSQSLPKIGWKDIAKKYEKLILSI